MRLLFLVWVAGLFCVPALAQDQDPNTKIPIVVPKEVEDRTPQAWCNIRDDDFDQAEWVEQVDTALPYYDFRPGTIDLDMSRSVHFLVITAQNMVWRSDDGDEVSISDVVPYSYNGYWGRPDSLDPPGTILRYEMDTERDELELNLPRFKIYTHDTTELPNEKNWTTSVYITCYTVRRR